MKDGSMFRVLKNYQDIDFLGTHGYGGLLVAWKDSEISDYSL